MNYVKEMKQKQYVKNGLIQVLLLMNNLKKH